MLMNFIVSTVPVVQNNEQMFSCNLSPAKPCDNSITGKTVNTHSEKLSQQKTCISANEKSNAYMMRQKRSDLEGKNNTETSQDSARKSLRLAARREYVNKRYATETEESREARLIAKHMRYEQSKLRSVQPLVGNSVSKRPTFLKETDMDKNQCLNGNQW